jgi:uncharacterized protein YndB with AHSA1/START domain
MAREKAEHATIVAERHFKAAPDKVFAAYEDPGSYGRWNVPGDDWKLAEFRHDFRAGGETVSRFGPEGDPHIHSEGHYLHIVRNRRIISAGTMFDGEEALSCTMLTVEMIPEGKGTHLILTDQSAFYSRETKADRTTGWGQILDRLSKALGEGR